MSNYGFFKNIFSLLFSFKGKIKRSPFVYGMVSIIFVYFFIVIISVIFFISLEEEMAWKDYKLLWTSMKTRTIPLALLYTYCRLAITVKRLRDCNFSSWLGLIMLFFPINFFFFFYLAFKSSVLPGEEPKGKLAKFLSKK